MTPETQALTVLVVNDELKEWLPLEVLSEDELKALVRGIAADAKKEGVYWMRRWMR